jgi:hypothetical protein
VGAVHRNHIIIYKHDYHYIIDNDNDLHYYVIDIFDGIDNFQYDVFDYHYDVDYNNGVFR